MRKKQLEIILQRALEDFHPKKAYYEQYSTPPNIAADMLFVAMEDIVGKKVADLGCGNGILGIGAKLLGAEKVFCVDIDERAIEIAKKNARKLGVEIEFYNMDVEDFHIPVDTVIQNPPFGCQVRNADRKFLRKAVEVGNIVYSLHRSETVEFIRKFCMEVLSAEAEEIKMYKFPIKREFEFHRDDVRMYNVSLIRIRRF